jgi:hypothetical protein
LGWRRAVPIYRIRRSAQADGVAADETAADKISAEEFGAEESDPPMDVKR